MSDIGGLIALACALLIAVPAVAASIGICLLGCKYMESSARQPELMNALLTKFFIIMGMIDAPFIICVGLSFLYYGKIGG